MCSELQLRRWKVMSTRLFLSIDATEEAEAITSVVWPAQAHRNQLRAPGCFTHKDSLPELGTVEDLCIAASE